MSKGMNREGTEKSKDEGEQAALIKIADTLLSEGTSIQKIAYLTGLTETEIKKLMSLNSTSIC